MGKVFIPLNKLNLFSLLNFNIKLMKTDMFWSGLIIGSLVGAFIGANIDIGIFALFAVGSRSDRNNIPLHIQDKVQIILHFFVT